MASTITAPPAPTECNYSVKDPVLANLFDRCKFAVGTLNTAEPNAAHEKGIVCLYEMACNMFGLITSSQPAARRCGAARVSGGDHISGLRAPRPEAGRRRERQHQRGPRRDGRRTH